MRRKLFLIRAIFFFSLILSSFQVKADKEASLFQLDFPDTITAETSRFLPVIVFDSLRAVDLVPFTLPYDITYWKAKPMRKKIALEKRFDSLTVHEKLTRRSVYNIAITRPDLIDFYDLHQFDNTLNDVKIKEKTIIVEGVDEPQWIPSPYTWDAPKRVKVIKPWTSSGELSLQFAQYYVTDNWAKGGTPNATFLSLVRYNINYEKGRWLWENKIRGEIGFYSTEVDTLRGIRVNNDETTLSTRIGFQTSMSKKLYYSSHIKFKTALLKGHKKNNDKEVSTSFLSPSKCYFGIIGLDYRYNDYMTAKIYPWTQKLIFVLPNSEVVHPKVGFDETRCHKWFPGFMIQSELKWRISKEILIESDLDIFNSYNFKHTDLDWRTTGRFIVNRFLSTRLSLTMLYDNARIDKKEKIQIQEQLSFGFTYSFRTKGIKY